MPMIGPTELIIVLAIIILIFGAGRLPQLGGALGKSIKEFRGAVHEPDDVCKQQEPNQK